MIEGACGTAADQETTTCQAKHLVSERSDIAITAINLDIASKKIRRSEAQRAYKPTQPAPIPQMQLLMQLIATPVRSKRRQPRAWGLAHKLESLCRQAPAL